MSIGFQWQDDGSVIVTCGGESLRISRTSADDTTSPPAQSARAQTPPVQAPPAKAPSAPPPPPVQEPPKVDFPTISRPDSGPLAVEIRLGGKFQGIYAVDAFEGVQRIGKASELSALIAKHRSGAARHSAKPAAVNLEWTSDKMVYVHDLTKRLENGFDGPVSIQLLPGKMAP
jgi:hypothetical protein